jgi:hypothetical protein
MQQLDDQPLMLAEHMYISASLLGPVYQCNQTVIIRLNAVELAMNQYLTASG